MSGAASIAGAFERAFHVGDGGVGAEERAAIRVDVVAVRVLVGVAERDEEDVGLRAREMIERSLRGLDVGAIRARVLSGRDEEGAATTTLTTTTTTTKRGKRDGDAALFTPSEPITATAVARTIR